VPMTTIKCRATLPLDLDIYAFETTAYSVLIWPT
jgi:hypothetical protein